MRESREIMMIVGGMAAAMLALGLWLLVTLAVPSAHIEQSVAGVVSLVFMVVGSGVLGTIFAIKL